MNLAQRIILALGALTVTVMVLFPPWVYVYSRPETAHRPGGPISYGAEHAERFAGYHPIWESNAPTDIGSLMRLFNMVEAPSYWRGDELVRASLPSLTLFSVRLDTTRLGIQILAALLVSALLTALFKTRKA